MKQLLYPLILVLIVQPTFSNPKEKSEKKKSSRWTLQEWLDQKGRNNLMDQWLAMNSSTNPYEFFIGGSWSNITRTYSGIGSGETLHTQYEAFLASYAGIFGLYGKWINSDEDMTVYKARVQLRLLGLMEQGTNLTLGYGFWWRQENDGINPAEDYSNQMASVDFTFYITGNFGIHLGWERIFRNRGSLALASLDGSIWELGAHIDFSFFRIYGEWFRDSLNYYYSAGLLGKRRTGIKVGTRFYF